ncbi:MAG: hypothetical protein HZC11_08270 [Nitrospirae bacterium]|nr:hypothetical protein [Nitrospirota bacterium]
MCYLRKINSNAERKAAEKEINGRCPCFLGKTAKLTEHGKERNRQISKKRYIGEQYFGLSNLHNNAYRARFTRLIKNAIDVLCRQMAFNLFRGGRVLGVV